MKKQISQSLGSSLEKRIKNTKTEVSRKSTFSPSCLDEDASFVPDELVGEKYKVLNYSEPQPQYYMNEQPIIRNNNYSGRKKSPKVALVFSSSKRPRPVTIEERAFNLNTFKSCEINFVQPSNSSSTEAVVNEIIRPNTPQTTYEQVIIEGSELASNLAVESDTASEHKGHTDTPPDRSSNVTKEVPDIKKDGKKVKGQNLQLLQKVSQLSQELEEKVLGPKDKEIIESCLERIKIRVQCSEVPQPSSELPAKIENKRTVKKYEKVLKKTKAMEESERGRKVSREMSSSPKLRRSVRIHNLRYPPPPLSHYQDQQPPHPHSSQDSNKLRNSRRFSSALLNSAVDSDLSREKVTQGGAAGNYNGGRDDEHNYAVVASSSVDLDLDNASNVREHTAEEADAACGSVVVTEGNDASNISMVDNMMNEMRGSRTMVVSAQTYNAWCEKDGEEEVSKQTLEYLLGQIVSMSEPFHKCSKKKYKLDPKYPETQLDLVIVKRMVDSGRITTVQGLKRLLGTLFIDNVINVFPRGHYVSHMATVLVKWVYFVFEKYQVEMAENSSECDGTGRKRRRDISPDATAFWADMNFTLADFDRRKRL